MDACRTPDALGGGRLAPPSQDLGLRWSNDAYLFASELQTAIDAGNPNLSARVRARGSVWDRLRGIDLSFSNRVYNGNGQAITFPTYFTWLLLDSTPTGRLILQPEEWDALNKQPAANLPVVAEGLRQGLVSDKLIFRFAGDPVLRYTKPQYIQDPPPPAPNPVTGWLDQVAQSVKGFTHYVIDNTSMLAQIGLTSLIRLAGIDPQEFLDKVTRLVGDFKDVAGQIAGDPLGYFTNLARWGGEALKAYIAGFPTTVLKAATAWLFEGVPGNLLEVVSSGIGKLSAGPLTLVNVGKVVVQAIAQLAGLTVAHARELLLARLSGLAASVVGPLIDAVAKELQDGDLDKLWTRLNEFARQVRDAAFNSDELKSMAFSFLLDLAKDAVVKLGIDLLISTLLPYAGGLKKLYDGVVWIFQNKEQLERLLATIGGMLKAVKEGEARVKEFVTKQLENLTGVALSALLALLKLDSLRDKIRDFLACVLNWLRSRVDLFINWLLDLVIKRKKESGGGCALPGAAAKAGMPKQGCPKPGKTGKCFGWRVPVQVPGGALAIRTLAVGGLVRTGGPEGGSRPRTDSGGEWRLRVVEVVLEGEDGTWVRARLLREVDWLASRGVEVGGQLGLDLEEMGAVGRGRVVSVEACPALPGWREGYGRVTGWFEHSQGEVLALGVSGEERALAVTAGHPVWSEDRRAYVAAGELEAGERLQAADGTTPRVTTLALLGQHEPVYNIEVEGDHCYRVGQQGLLVHNASVPLPVTVGGHTDGEDLATRTNVNNCLVETYFTVPPVTKLPILQIAAGRSVYPGAVSLDIQAWGGYTMVMVTTTEEYTLWFKDHKFLRVVAINPLNSGDFYLDNGERANYSWIFEKAKPVTASGGYVTVVAGIPNHVSLNWIRLNLDKIRDLGYELIAADDKVPSNALDAASPLVLGTKVVDPIITGMKIDTHDRAGRPVVFDPADPAVARLLYHTRIVFKKK